MSSIPRRFRSLLSLVVIVLVMACAEEDSVERRNVLLILIDTVRADHLGCYGYERDITPTMDSLAQEGVMWANFQGQAAWTLPSMASIFSGLTERQHLAGIRDELQYALNDGFTVLPEVFQEAGYTTAGFYTVPVMGEGYGFQQGLDYADLEGCEVIFTADVMVDKYLFWADNIYDGESDFLTVLHLFDPHFQYAPPPMYAALFSPLTHPGNQWATCPASSMIEAWGQGLISSSALSRMMDLYDGEIAFMDDQFKRLFQELRERGMLDGTLVVIVADHGEEFGEHGGVTHGVQLYSEVTGVPMMMAGPGVPAGEVREGLAGHVDVAPTILAWAGLPPMEVSDGIDLLSMTPEPDRVLPASGYYADVNPDIIVRRGDMKLFWNTETGESVMYDLSVDPLEQDPLPPDSGLIEEAAYYWSTPPVLVPDAMPFMEERVAMFRNLGYLR